MMSLKEIHNTVKRKLHMDHCKIYPNPPASQLVGTEENRYNYREAHRTVQI
jgi:hypothetical protein